MKKEKIDILYIRRGEFDKSFFPEFVEFSTHAHNSGYNVLNVAEKGNYNQDEKNILRLSVDNVLTRLFFFARSAFELKRKKLKISLSHLFYGRMCFLFPLILGKNCSNYILDLRSGPITTGYKRLLFWIIFLFESKFFNSVIILEKEMIPDWLRKKYKSIFYVPMGFSSSLLSVNNKIQETNKSFSSATFGFYVGYLDKARCLDMLIKGYHIAYSKNNNIGKLIFAGDGDYQNELKKLVNELNLTDQIHFVGRIERSKIPDYVKNARFGMFWVPCDCKYDQQMPTKVLEYLASGLPVLSAKTSAMKRLVAKMEATSGVYLVDNDVTSISQVLNYLFSNEKVELKLNFEILKSYTWEYLGNYLINNVYENKSNKIHK